MPFSGMDPYIERSEIWPDFHNSLVAYIREALQPQLRPRTRRSVRIGCTLWNIGG